MKYEINHETGLGTRLLILVLLIIILSIIYLGHYSVAKSLLTNTVVPTGSSFNIQGSSPNLQSSAASGFVVQPAAGVDRVE